MMPHSEEVVMVRWFPMIGGALLLLAVFVLAAHRRGYRKDGGSFMTRVAFAVVLVFAVAALSVRTSVRQVSEPSVMVAEEFGPFRGSASKQSSSDTTQIVRPAPAAVAGQTKAP